MSTNPTSFRYPFTLPEDIHPQLALAIKNSFNGILDLNQAVAALNLEVKANTKTVTTVVQTAATASGSPPTTPTFGTVNLQPNLTPGAYTTAQADFAGLILVNSSIAFALTLSSSLMLPFFTTVYNFGAGTVTVTPSAGTVNGLPSVTLTTGQFGVFYFDSTLNWWDVFALLAQTFAAIPSEWLRSYDSTTGLFTASQPAASDLSNGTQGTGAVVLASALSAITPLSATSGSLGGSPLIAGQTIKIATSVPGATTSMVAIASPQTYPGDSFDWYAYVDSTNSVTVALTAVLAGTPAASLYNLRVVE